MTEEIVVVDGNLPSLGVAGNLDIVSASGISGWLAPIHIAGAIRVFLDGELVASGVQRQQRPDISAMVGDDHSFGFRLSWYPAGLAAVADKSDAGYALVFEAQGMRFTFANCQHIAAETVKNLVASIFRSLKPMSAKALKEGFASILGQMEPDARTSGDVKLIAYYLPQFHPIPENDSWWGEGFTEWTNVVTARSLFKGHYQPQLPGELGFYDLRYAGTRQEQADLARAYGIYGFCYYYYWFKGRRLLEQPLDEVLATGEPDFPFCICWANETWSRRWDGSEEDVLIAQTHDSVTDAAFIRDVIPILLDPRYIRINGAPLLMVYRTTLLPDPMATAKLWRGICAEHGVERVHLCAADTFELEDPRLLGFDSAAQFPPHRTTGTPINAEVEDLPHDYEGVIYDYAVVAREEMMKPCADHLLFPGVMTAWDNTPRRGKRGTVFHNATPGLYEVWLRSAMDRARATLPSGQRFVFINAWNEWAEGAHLEPDRKNGRAWLEATRRALTSQNSWRQLLEYASVTELKADAKTQFLADLGSQIERMEQELNWYESLYATNKLPPWTKVKPGEPKICAHLQLIHAGKVIFDQINQDSQPIMVHAAKEERLFCRGWAFTPGLPLSAKTPGYLLLLAYDTDQVLYHGFISRRQERPDIMELETGLDESITYFSGFSHSFDVADVSPGVYRLGMLSLGNGRAAIAISSTSLEIE